MEVVPYFKMLREERKRLLKFSINCPNFKEIHKDIKKLEKLIGRQEVGEIHVALEVYYYKDEE